MKLSKIDLSNVVAIGHEDGMLGLLIDRGNDIEYLEIPAPSVAYQGLAFVNYLANIPSLPSASSPAILEAAEDYIDTYDCCE